MVTFVPTRGVVDHLREAGQLKAWGEIVKDLHHANVTPVIGFDTRQRLVGNKYEAYVEPGKYEGQDAFYIVHLRARQDVVAIPRQRQVVGHEVKRRKSGKSYGSGRRWPTTWEELLTRLKACPGVEVRRGGKHLNVMHHGKQVQTLPLTASDRRALLNACQILRGLGIDVRREERA